MGRDKFEIACDVILESKSFTIGFSEIVSAEWSRRTQKISFFVEVRKCSVLSQTQIFLAESKFQLFSNGVIYNRRAMIVLKLLCFLIIPWLQLKFSLAHESPTLRLFDAESFNVSLEESDGIESKATSMALESEDSSEKGSPESSDHADILSDNDYLEEGNRTNGASKLSDSSDSEGGESLSGINEKIRQMSLSRNSDYEVELVLKKYFEWLEESGGEDLVSSSTVKVDILMDDIPQLGEGTMKKSRSEMGLVARRNITAGEIVYVIPRKLWILSSDFYDELHLPADVLGEWHGNIAVTAFLLREKAKGDSSVWHSFLSILPRYIPVPHYYDEALLDELQDSDLIQHIKARKKFLDHIYQQINPEDIGHATNEEFYWAHVIVWSRCFSYTKDLLLLPFADFANHDSNYNTDWEILEDNVTFKACKNITEGSPIHISYHLSSSEHFLTAYGFVPKENKQNRVKLFDTIDELVKFHAVHVEGSIFFGFDKNTSIEIVHKSANAVKEMLDASETDNSKNEDFMFCAYGDGKVKPHLLAAFGGLWHFHSEESEVDYRALARGAIIYSEYEDNVIRCEDEDEFETNKVSGSLYVATNLVHRRIQEMLWRFPTSISEDQKYLAMVKDCSLTKPKCRHLAVKFNREIINILEYRLNRKLLLRNALDRLEQSCDIDYDW